MSYTIEAEFPREASAAIVAAIESLHPKNTGAKGSFSTFEIGRISLLYKIWPTHILLYLRYSQRGDVDLVTKILYEIGLAVSAKQTEGALHE